MITPGRPPTLDFGRAFRRYPTRSLSGSDVLITTAAGEAVIGGAPVAPDGELVGFLSPDVIGRVLVSARSGCTVDTLSGELRPVAARPSIEFQLIWLLKHGLLSLQT